MKSAKKSKVNRSSGIRGQQQKRQGPILVYVILFISVSIVMITLNQTRKRNLQNQGLPGTQTQQDPNKFNKEGELDFLNASGENITSIDIEIADDNIQTQRGLMYRRSMKEDRGMLFIFPDVEERSFWMKNTFLSLDIMYLDANKNIVSIIENAQPKSKESLWSEFPAKYVVEVNAGFVALHQIKVGDKIKFTRVY